MTRAHAEQLESSFAGQAGAFEDDRLNQVFATGMEWLFEHVALSPDALALDVAGGTGHAARSLAPVVRTVVVLDLTAAMLEAGQRAARERGLDNIVFVRGDATSAPFLDAAFDIVVSRFAVHHFERPTEQLSEMLRCVRPGGQVVVADLVADDDPAVARRQNALERRRDPSHTTILTAAALQTAVEELGGVVTHTAARTVDRPLAPWLEQTACDAEAAEEIERALTAELAGGEPTGLAPSRREGELWFQQRFASVTARRPDSST